MQNLEKATNYSNEKIGAIRESLTKHFSSLSHLSVVAVGSLARREASEQSDLDYFVLSKKELSESERKEIISIMATVASAEKIKLPSVGGAFADCIAAESLSKGVGGPDDQDHQLTRRILFLLESEWLFNEDLYESTFKEIIGQYVNDKITEHQICRFLLNDLIRYYRTIGVNFEHKTKSGREVLGR